VGLQLNEPMIILDAAPVAICSFVLKFVSLLLFVAFSTTLLEDELTIPLVLQRLSPALAPPLHSLSQP
jgi:hypothetical protein